VRATQRPDGSWYGRWGVNYLYGTWSVMAGLRAIGEDMAQPYIRRAVAWLLSRQNPDGGWGESCYSYNDPRTAGMGKSTPSQTAWALLALMHAGDAEHPAVARGIQFLLERRAADDLWAEPEFTGTGFPRVFYLRYHSYPRIFPLWALAMYRRLAAGTKGRSAATGRVHQLAARR
jgi:squalene-hopene/tetraprenyl-beta-curcumene cyclase